MRIYVFRAPHTTPSPHSQATNRRGSAHTHTHTFMPNGRKHIWPNAFRAYRRSSENCHLRIARTHTHTQQQHKNSGSASIAYPRLKLMRETGDLLAHAQASWLCASLLWHVYASVCVCSKGASDYWFRWRVSCAHTHSRRRDLHVARRRVGGCLGSDCNYTMRPIRRCASGKIAKGTQQHNSTA